MKGVTQPEMEEIKCSCNTASIPYQVPFIYHTTYLSLGTVKHEPSHTHLVFEGVQPRPQRLLHQRRQGTLKMKRYC